MGEAETESPPVSVSVCYMECVTVCVRVSIGVFLYGLDFMCVCPFHLSVR